jgi:hypothetical protein
MDYVYFGGVVRMMRWANRSMMAYEVPRVMFDDQ